MKTLKKVVKFVVAFSIFITPILILLVSIGLNKIYEDEENSDDEFKDFDDEFKDSGFDLDLDPDLGPDPSFLWN